jgi:outer membrane lipoprotein-sorting protein
MDDMRNTRFYFRWLAIVSISFLGTTVFGGEATTLDQVLSRMEAVGSGLESMRAEIHQKKWTAILEEFDEGESGQFTFLKTDQGVFLRKDINDPTNSTLVIKEGKVIFYQPSIKQAQMYNMGGHGDKAEFLLLGFGSNKQALSDTYEITLLGQEKVQDRNTFQLELKPKSENVAAFFVRIVLWVDDEMWVPIQEQLEEPTEDYLLIRFSEVQLDARLSKSDFEVKLPADVKIIQN